jgi:micrococcal nuclease
MSLNLGLVKFQQTKTLLILLIASVFFIFSQSFATHSESKYEVVKIIDGDTIRVVDKNAKRKQQIKVRLIGVDSLETDKNLKSFKDAKRLHSSQAKMKQGGLDAKSFLTTQIPIGTSVKLEFDKEKYDLHGRTLAYVYKENGDFINKLLVQNGFAGLLIYYPNDSKAQELQNAYYQAQNSKSGLWGQGYTLTYRWKRKK